ncbi:MAG: DUF2934 domain-containing protein [Methylococcus sp.]|nr:DUF2934 domain-containing protein [Methylococcus sp.]
MNARILSQTAKRDSFSELDAAVIQPDPDLLNLLIAERAYFKAEQRGFEEGRELDDWLQAEMEVRQMQEQLSIPTPD